MRGFAKSGGFVLALDNGLHGFDPESGKLSLLVHPEPDEPGNRYNDGRCDRRGRLWIGTMDLAIRRASGSFYRVSADRTVLRLFDGITVPNSTAFSPDDRTLYFADTPRHVIWAFDFNLHAGMIGERRVFADLTGRQGHPDGSCVDAEGFLWNAEYGGRRLTRYAPDGQVDRTVELPVTHATCCCFGGDNLDTLYVTTATPSKPGSAPQPMDGGCWRSTSVCAACRKPRSADDWGVDDGHAPSTSRWCHARSSMHRSGSPSRTAISATRASSRASRSSTTLRRSTR